MPNLYESAAKILESLAKPNEPVNKKKDAKKDTKKESQSFPSVTSTQLKSLIYTNSRSTTTNTITSSSKKQVKNTNNQNNNNDLRQLYAIVASTLKYAPILRPVVRASDLLNPKFPTFRYFVNEWHAMAMVQDLLFSKSGRITAPKCKAKEAVLQNKTRLHGEFVKWKVRNRVRDPKTDLEKFTVPILNDAQPVTNRHDDDDENLDENDETPVRWVRLNAIKCTTPDDLVSREQELTNEGELKFVSDWHDIRKNTDLVVYKDKIVANLYGVHPKRFPIITTKLYTSGKLIIQDRASCLPATILVHNLKALGVDLKPPSELQSGQKLKKGEADKSSIQLIDACAAPGNKTTHLTGLSLTAYPRLFAAAFTKNGNKNPLQHKFVAAFERNEFRAKTLSKMLNVAGASKYVNVNVQDFTQSKPSDYPNVSGFVVDPSCSGSGIFGRKNAATLANENNAEENEENSDNKKTSLTQDEETRLLKLAGFQYKVVKHALSFPNARVVVYSTCSIHAHENEHVVDRLMNDPQVAQAWGWRVQSRKHVVPDWPRRGFPEEFPVYAQKHAGEEDELFERERMAEGCVRALPKEDGGIGFFAVCFVRDLPESEDNKGEGEDEDEVLDQEEEWGGFSD
ncbi:uncharacterized protein SAPINGB_P000894 [Magnusiomyces paraingens]|uniref:SAM-dependent MTase RsmB/NOP-type domain-containing protein n=1 Tax=Magnusiomyces paraingens TaxID=2606893 RepID=A0A5E8B2X5_9ASCO|nr:uncharacterized protein SAPINGB_P000894 [Saprochaete ingens]VVT45794.1 unnamed protein product [Saprochaete ingens]